MTNPKDTAAQLAAELSEALEQLALTENRRKELEEVQSAAADIAARLAYFHDEYVPLHLNDLDRKFADAYRQWEVLDPGHVDGTVLDRLVAISEPLNRLYRAGITIKSAKKFSSCESEFATVLGDNFAALARGWDFLKKSTERKNPNFGFRREHLPVARTFVELLSALGLVSVIGYEYRDFSKEVTGEWIANSADSVPRNVDRKRPMRARLNWTNNRRAQSLFTGEWLNAYAAGLVHDHLIRNSMPHEVYTNVQYSAPGEIIHVSGDFDVLVQSGESVAVFECKAGPLDESRGDFKQVIEKTAGLRRVIEKTGAGVHLESLLLFNPQAAERSAVEAALKGTGIRAITPDEVRRLSMELFSARG